MELSEYKSTLPLELLAASLVARLTLDELEWLCGALVRRAEEKRRKVRVATSVGLSGAKNG